MCGPCIWLSWSRTQGSVALSSSEAEFYALTSGAVEGRFAASLLAEFGEGPQAIRLETDSSGAKGSAERPGPQRMKHIALRHMFLKDLIRSKIIEIGKIQSAQNPADGLTKAVEPAILQRNLELLSGFTVEQPEAVVQALDAEGQPEWDRTALLQELLVRQQAVDRCREELRILEELCVRGRRRLHEAEVRRAQWGHVVRRRLHETSGEGRPSQCATARPEGTTSTSPQPLVPEIVRRSRPSWADITEAELGIH